MVGASLPISRACTSPKAIPDPARHDAMLVVNRQ